jgi:hypothetical protein
MLRSLSEQGFPLGLVAVTAGALLLIAVWPAAFDLVLVGLVLAVATHLTIAFAVFWLLVRAAGGVGVVVPGVAVAGYVGAAALLAVVLVRVESDPGVLGSVLGAGPLTGVVLYTAARLFRRRDIA